MHTTRSVVTGMCPPGKLLLLPTADMSIFRIC